MIATLERTTTVPKHSLTTRAENVLSIPLRFVESDDFENLGIVEQIATQRGEDRQNLTDVRPPATSQRDRQGGGCIRMSDTPPLEPARETELFRRLNYLKFEACRLRDSLVPDCPNQQRLDDIERLLSEAADVRDLLIRANIRLVMSIAKRFTSDNHLFEDLVSEGTVAVMNAIEHFDYQRGFRFSTYATQAIRRCFYRLLARRAKQQPVMGGDASAILESLPEAEPAHPMSESAVASLGTRMRELLAVLDAREQRIIQARFGLGSLDDGQTLQSIADQLGVCKERVRQLEQRAFRKLRALASEWQLDEYLT